MAEVAERHYLDEHGVPESRISGLAVTRHGYGRPTRLVRVVEAGHPMPDAAGLAATVETLDLADSAGAEDLVLVLIRSEEHTSELQSLRHLVCRLLLEKKKKKTEQ